MWLKAEGLRDQALRYSAHTFRCRCNVRCLRPWDVSERMRNGSGYPVGQKVWELSEFICPSIDFLFCCCLYKVFLLFSVLHLNLEYPGELWRCLSCFDTCIIFNTCWHMAWRTKTCIHIRRMRLFTYQLTVWYLQNYSFVFLMYFMIR